MSPVPRSDDSVTGGLRGASMVQSAAPSYSLASNVDLNHPRRRISIVESIKQGLGMTPLNIPQIPADIKEEEEPTPTSTGTK